MFDVSVAYDEPSDEQDRRDLAEQPIRIDTDMLAGLVAGEEEYGKALSGLLFGHPMVRTIYDRAVGSVSARGIPLHLRLLLDPRAPMRYHSVRWESVRDPATGNPVTTQPNLFFSRYLSNLDWRPFRPTRWDRLKALVVVADPSDLGSKRRVGRPDVPLHPIDRPAELDRARRALADRMDVVELAAPGEATLKKIMAALDEGIDVLYLVCHGGLVDGHQPRLYLEDEAGLTDVVDAGLLANRLSELDHPPTIAVLCSCQSAGAGDEEMASDAGALSAAGPRLSGAGVAAVVAMQGDISMATAEVFFPAFFEELVRRRGVVDQAMAAARGAIRHRERDWWMPVLFTRLRRGRAWYQPEFGDDNDLTFRAVTTQILMKSCTPIIGSGVAGEGILPSREELAAAWAERWLMPIAGQNRVDLAKVAQYLSVYLAAGQPRTELRHHLRTALTEKYGEAALPSLQEATTLGPMIRAAGEQHRRQAQDSDPYVALAALRLPIYITTSWNELLEDAIRAAGREPDSQYFDWHEKRQRRVRRQSDAEPDPDREPDPEHPLVYHLFGSIDDESSLVIGEDDYFSWMKSWIKRVDKDPSIPDSVANALTDSTLLFLGYRLDDWEFRVLFQGIKSFEGLRLREKVHVGVQVSPETNVIEPESAQDYLKRYFDEDKVHVYWGTCQAFLTDLSRRMQIRRRDG
jgi:hypothetical protein